MGSGFLKFVLSYSCLDRDMMMRTGHLFEEQIFENVQRGADRASLSEGRQAAFGVSLAPIEDIR